MENWIHDIEIKNFKSIRNAKIEDCRRINVFIGYPNVGKSNILEALSTIQLCKTGDSNNIHKFLRFEDAAELFFEAGINRNSIVSYNYLRSVYITFQNSNVVEFRAGNFEKDASYLKSGDEIGNSELLDLFKYEFKSQGNFGLGSTYKHLDSPNGTNFFLILRENIELRKTINEVLKTYGLRLLLDKVSNSLKLIKTLDSDSIFQISYSLLADTLQRLFFYQAAIQSNRKSVLLFEEPEAHMFPPYIAKFTSNIIYDKNKNQYFMATHSPFVLNDFMEDLDKNELSIYAVGYSNGETKIRRLSDEQITEVYQYGVDLFFNLEDYLKDVVS